jgi:hypothetical protein
MKKLKGVLSVLIAVSTMMLFSSCCSLHCHNLVQNGSFEEPAVTPPFPYSALPASSHWQSAPQTNNTDIVTNGGGANTPNFPASRFFNTSRGHQFVNIQGTIIMISVGSISQVITNLIANKKYCLSFLQSSEPYIAISHSGLDQVPGVIQVQLMSSAGVNILPISTFSVPTNTAWMKKCEKFKVPEGGSGSYTLTFSSVATNPIYIHGTDQNGEAVANLDAVRLCKKPWWIFW